MNIRFELIQGFVIGVEFFFEDDAILLELGFFRVIFNWE
jgi:hypothetical protein